MNIDFKIDNNRFNARASAIIYNKSKTKVLLNNIGGYNYYLLPGGRIEFNEDSFSAIKREIQEELGYTLNFKLCSINENFVEKDGIKVTQYNFCYKAVYDGIISKDKIICKDNENQFFYWIDINKINDYVIYPKSSYELIKENNQIIKHIIEK